METSPGNLEDIYPLSPMQQGMLFHTLYSARGEAPLLQWSCRFENGVDVPALRRVWERVIERHAILRTAVVLEEGGEPVQVVFRSVPLPWQERDLRELSPADRKRSVREFLEQDRHAGFELLEPPLMRFTLIRLTENASVLIWTSHLLLLDGWSMAAVLNEMWALYEAFCRGEEPRLESRRPYRDYIAWYQRPNPVLAEPFWRKTLKGIVAPTPMAIDRTPMTAVDPGGDYAEEEIRLSPDATRALHSFCRQYHLTLSTLLRASWALLLSRYCGETSVVFGATVSGRPPDLPGVESIVGLLINTLPVRVDVPEDEPVLTWLKRLQEQQSELLEYESSRLVDVQGWSEVPRGLPLFESVLVVQTYPVDEALRLRRKHLGIHEAFVFARTNIPLTVEVKPREELSIKASFECARFESSAILGMLSHFRTLLERMVADPAQKVFALSPLTEDERRRLLIDWNATQRTFDRARPVHELFEAQAQATPDAVAVVCGAHRRTYREIEEHATRIASSLRLWGAGPEVRVGLCAQRSIELVVGALAILKAGAAYVPLDPGHPPQRIARMLADAGVSLVLTQTQLEPLLRGLPAKAVRIDSEWPISPDAATGPKDRRTGPDNLAYVIYTSGSTGRPKGVAVRHAGLTNLVRWHQETYRVTPNDRASLVASPAFDASVWELWPYLTAGASVHIPEEETRMNPAALSRWLESEKITVSFLPTPLAQAVLAEPEPPRGKLRLLLTGGEQLRPPARREYGFELVNHYGPTETTVVATAGTVAMEPATERLPSIGRPIANMRIYLLDRHRALVPIGVAGEICIGGIGVARGYLNNPDLTAGMFIDDPFGDGHLYRSGDLGRYRPDGQIEYLGRLDEQVKIRGVRIELGEIEAALASHPAVAEAVVAAVGDPGEGRRLVAYVVPSPDSAPSARSLRTFLEERLPASVVPSQFLLLAALPLTRSGKIDRRALPVPEATRDSLESAFAPPSTPVEEILAGIWSDVLKIERIGVRDNFFELGGHSILATQVFSRIRDNLQVILPLRHLFERPTVQSLAAFVEAARADRSEPLPPPLTPVSRDRELPLSFAQQRLWFIDQLEPGGSSYNTRRALLLKGRVNHEALRRAVEEVVSRHESLRTTFESREGRPVQVVSELGRFALAVEDLSGRGGDVESEARRRVEEEVRRPFDLAHGPLFRASLFRLGPEEHIFVVVMHHIVCDGWSMGVFFRELEALYAAFSRGESSPLSPLSLQYADYAVWERDWFQGEVLEKQLSYWTEQLRGAPAVLDLRGDRPRPVQRDFRGARQRFIVSASVSERIAALSRSEGVTLYMTLLAAFAVLLWRRTGQEEIAVGSPIFGRDRIETEGLIGFFINTIVLRTDLKGNPSFRELLLRVREMALGAYAHQDVPLERLVDALKLERSLSHNPLFQVWFVLQNAGGLPPALAGLSVEEVSLETRTIRHDLQLSISETQAGLTAELEYATDIFDVQTIASLACRFETLLCRVAANPESRLEQLQADLDGAEQVEREERRRQRDSEMRRRLEIGKRRTVRG